MLWNVSIFTDWLTGCVTLSLTTVCASTRSDTTYMLQLIVMLVYSTMIWADLWESVKVTQA